MTKRMDKTALAIKLLETDSNFIEIAGSCVNSEWFHLPNWYKKVGEGVYEEYEPKDVPVNIKKTYEDANNI